jgi:hypothetical protein
MDGRTAASVMSHAASTSSEVRSGMPRPGPRRPYVGVRPDLDQLEEIDRLAAKETAGNRSEMLRKLLGEALAGRALGGEREERQA